MWFYLQWLKCGHKCIFSVFECVLIVLSYYSVLDRCIWVKHIWYKTQHWHNMLHEGLFEIWKQSSIDDTLIINEWNRKTRSYCQQQMYKHHLAITLIYVHVTCNVYTDDRYNLLQCLITTLFKIVLYFISKAWRHTQHRLISKSLCSD